MKNFPNTWDFAKGFKSYKQSSDAYISAVIEWRTNFDKELRERIKALEIADRTAYGKAILKEILGE